MGRSKSKTKNKRKRPTRKKEVAVREATVHIESADGQEHVSADPQENVSADPRENVKAELSLAARLAQWVVTVWLVAMTCWYAWTAAQAVLHPPNAGDDLKLAGAWLAFVVTVVLSHLIFRRRTVTLLWCAALITVGGSMIVLSKQVVAALITIWLLALAWTWGDWLLGRMGAKSSDVPLEWVCLCLSIGLALLSMVGLTLLIAHRMSALWAWIVLSVLTVVQWKSFLGLFERIRRNATAWSASRAKKGLPEQGILLLLMGFIGLFNLAWGLAPEIMYDSLNYHLAVPKAYLADHRIVNLHYGYNAHLVETIYTVALALHGQIVAKLLTLAMGIIATLGVYALGRKVFNHRVGLWSAALFYSTPLVSWLSSSTYIDLIVAMFLLATILAFLQWRGTRQIVWLWATGFLGGAAVGAKLNAAFGLPVIAILLVWELLRTRDLAVWSKVKGFAGCTLAAFLVAGPYFLINYVFTGNPFFPLLNGIFSRGSFQLAANINTDAAKFSLGHSPLALLRFPFVLTFDRQHYGQSPGSLGLCLVVLPVALILLFLRRTETKLLWLVSGVYLVLLVYTVPVARYGIPILPVVVVLAVATVFRFSTAPWMRRVNVACLGLAIVAQAALISIQFWQIPDRFPLKLASGLETQEAFLARGVIPYQAAQYLNRVTGRDRKVIGSGVKYVRFYLDAPLVSVPELHQLQQDVPVSALAGTLISNGYDYLMVERQGPDSQSTVPLLSQYFLDHFTTIEFTARRVNVYRLSATPQLPGSGRGENLLTNPGFEKLLAPGRPAEWHLSGKPRFAENPAEAHTGNVSVQATGNTGLFKRVAVVPGEMYALGHWSRADRPDQFGRLQVNWLNGKLKLLDANIEVFRAQPGWTWNEVYATAPAGASVADIFVSVHEEGTVWFDDYVFRKVTR